MIRIATGLSIVALAGFAATAAVDPSGRAPAHPATDVAGQAAEPHALPAWHPPVHPQGRLLVLPPGHPPVLPEGHPPVAGNGSVCPGNGVPSGRSPVGQSGASTVIST